MLKKTLAVLAGIITSSLIIKYGNVYIFKRFPVLETFSKLNWNLAKQLVGSIPRQAWHYLILEWFVAAVVCGFILKLISHSSKIALPIGCGAFLTLAAIMDQFVNRPHPTWVVAVGVLIFIPSTLLGFKLCWVKIMSKEEEDAEEESDLA